MAPTYIAQQQYLMAGSPAHVFRFLVTPNLLTRWFLSDARLAARKGGTFSFDWMGGYHMDGELLECRPGKAVAFLWTDSLPNGRVARTRAAFRVTKKGKGTLLRLRHSGFTDPGHFAECSSRWAYYLMNLKSVIETDHDLRSPSDW